jgi:DNA-binding NtrC family response regulator
MNNVNGHDACVVVVDDDMSIRESLSNLIRSTGRKVKTFASAQEFLAGPRREIPGCVVLDVQLPGLSGLDLQKELAKVQPQIPIIFITGHGDIPMTVRAMKAGAIEFLTKPFHDEDLVNAIEQGMQCARQSPQAEKRPAGEKVPGQGGGRITFSRIVGESTELRHVMNAVATVAPTDSTVLIQGESGTGKELIARAVHDLSTRRNGPFVKLNCAAIPTGLLESELFGHEKGAFTSAIAWKAGRFELASGGTLFLDEIGDIPLELQPKLLRVLQDQEFERVGSSRTLRVNVRIVAATNRPLVQMVSEREFRNDLYYRLNVFPIQLPPLRERRNDIPILVRYFIDKFSARLGKRIDSISPDTMETLLNYDWPGNVRELENVVERAMILSSGNELVITLSKPPEVHKPRAALLTFVQAERQHILQALEEAHWVVGGPNGAAAKLGLKRTSLAYKMQRLDIVSVRKRRRFVQQGAVAPDAHAESQCDGPISSDTGSYMPTELSKLMSTKAHVLSDGAATYGEACVF